VGLHSPPLTTLIGDAFVLFYEWAWPRVAPRLEDIADRVADAVRPDPPMIVRTLAGEILTGFVVVDAGRVLAFLGTRAGPTPAPPHGYGCTPRHPQYDDGEPLWPSDVPPHRR
jgi:hypothetical protein